MLAHRTASHNRPRAGKTANTRCQAGQARKLRRRRTGVRAALDFVDVTVAKLFCVGLARMG